MTQDEANGLIQVLKRILETGVCKLPEQGRYAAIGLESVFSSKDKFIIDINRAGHINAKKYTLQLRYKKETFLLRLDVGGPPHTNPDLTVIPCPHLHIWRAGQKRPDAWAFEIPVIFGDTEDKCRTLLDFLRYCNTNNIEQIEIYEQRKME
ncbi:DUF6978 family protein [Beduinella massiliensis]|uniref:DUF6978 family protein n=1 Tax=Beduinella massiliensis TaxID=1852363 RepID=UPI0011AF3568